MSLQPLPHKAGVMIDMPSYTRAAWASDSDKWRWVDGYGQSQLGAERSSQQALRGPSRGTLGLSTRFLSDIALWGTYRSLEAQQDSFVYNITPLRSSGTFANDPFTTVSGSATVTVTLTAHGASTGDRVFLRDAAVVHGIQLGGANGTLAANSFSTTDRSNFVVVTDTAHGFATGNEIVLFGGAAVGGLTLGGVAGIAFGADPFTTLINSMLVTATLADHGYKSGDQVVIAGSSAVGGITPAGFYLINVLDADTFTFRAATAASSTATGGGAGVTGDFGRAYLIQRLDVDSFAIFADSNATSSATGGGTPTFQRGIAYEVTVVDVDTFTVVGPNVASGNGAGGGAAVRYGFEIGVGNVDAAGLGYGLGYYGLGPYGTGGVDAFAQSQPRTWCLVQLGPSAICSPFGGPQYLWQGNLSQRAWIIDQAPAINYFVLATAEGCVMALGCSMTDGSFNPLGVRNSDTYLPLSWSPGIENSIAGETVVAVGSHFVAGCVVVGGILTVTDLGAFLFRFSNSADQVYTFDPLGSNCGCIGPNALRESNGRVFWMSQTPQLWEYTGGRPQKMRCGNIRWLGRTLDTLQGYKVFAYYDSKYPAIVWLFPAVRAMGMTPECDTYLRLDIDERFTDPDAGWSVGTWDRSAWLDRGLDTVPLACRATDFFVMQQEIGEDDDGAPMAKRVRWGPFEPPTQEGQGQRMQSLRRLLLSIDQTRDVIIDVTLQRFPNRAGTTKTYTQTPTTDQLITRGAGRQFVLEYTTDGFMRLGDDRADWIVWSLR